MLDRAVDQVVCAFKEEGMWTDTVLVFTSDNGGIGPGSNYPLRGMKVLNWEGGIKVIGFVKGTDSMLAPLPAGTVHVFHSAFFCLPCLSAMFLVEVVVGYYLSSVHFEC